MLSKKKHIKASSIHTMLLQYYVTLTPFSTCLNAATHRNSTHVRRRNCRFYAKTQHTKGISLICRARRRVRYEEEKESDEEYGDNLEIAMLEAYSERQREKALLIKATVDGEEEYVLIFKGYSSSLSSATMPDPSKSILPERAVIQSIDVIRGPFDPTNIEYLEKGVTWEAFKTRL